MPDLSPKREYVEAPAGHGKTEAIVFEVEKRAIGKKVLVLTHTNAGVNSLKKRFRKLNVQSNKYDLWTIDSFCLRFSQYYPSISFISKKLDDFSGEIYKQARIAAIKIFDFQDLRTFLKAKYCYLIVDEYQDCSMSQHNLILKLSESIDCLVFGDPLQGIFDFASEGFNWETNLYSNFQPSSCISLDIPHRWINHGNEELGYWIKSVREKLLLNKIDELHHIKIPNCIKVIGSETRIDDPLFTVNVANKVCSVIPESGSVLILVNGGPARRYLHFSVAEKMYIPIQAIEKIDSPRLITFLSDLDTFLRSYRRSPNSLYKLIREFSMHCMTGIPSHTTSIKSKLDDYPKKSISDIIQSCKRFTSDNSLVVQSLLDIYEKRNAKNFINHIQRLMKFIESNSVKKFNKELWYSALDSIKLFQNSDNKSLKHCGIEIRQKTSFIGRNFTRVIGTTLLTKGLEFDHVIIVDPKSFDNKNLYVAFSRACKSITLISVNHSVG